MNGSGVTSAATSGIALSGQQARFSDNPHPPKVSDPKVNRKPDFPVQQPPSVLDTSLFSRVIDAVTSLIRWPIENRLGLAKLFGALVVPAQFSRSDVPGLEILNDACDDRNQKSGHRVRLGEAVHGNTRLRVAVCYPPDWPDGDTSRCVLYHNPNAITVAEYFHRNCYDAGDAGQERYDFHPRLRHSGLRRVSSDHSTSPAHCPGVIQDMRKCPVIFYDYRGAGINQQITPFFPTCETVVQDGQATLHYALTHFDEVEVFGTSLGGAVATASVDRYQCSPDVLKDRIKSVNVLDSCSDTSHVLFPKQGDWIKTLGWLFGADLDGKKHVDSLISKGFNVAVSNHTCDDVVPPEARLATQIPVQDVSKPNVQVHLSGSKTNQNSYFNHGSLTEDVQRFLGKDQDH